MSDLSELYQELILDHQRSPRNFGDLPGANHHADGYNPLCGDKIVLDLILDDKGVVTDVKFKGSGCAISKASASLMTVAIKGKTRKEVEKMFKAFHDMVTGTSDIGKSEELLGKLKVFSGVRDYPSRVKCASLAWHTLIAALDGTQKKKTISTEGPS